MTGYPSVNIEKGVENPTICKWWIPTETARVLHVFLYVYARGMVCKSHSKQLPRSCSQARTSMDCAVHVCLHHQLDMMIGCSTLVLKMFDQLKHLVSVSQASQWVSIILRSPRSIHCFRKYYSGDCQDKSLLGMSDLNDFRTPKMYIRMFTYPWWTCGCQPASARPVIN